MFIKNRLVEFASKYVGRDPYQYGFVENSGTLCATTDFVNYISSELDKGNFVVAIYIDLQKAFDVVDHTMLLDKLEKMGVRGVALSLLKTYLSNRRQYVTLNLADSAMLFNAAGLQQGSVLGPLRYTLHVLSLKNIKLSCKYFSFADNTVLVFRTNVLQEAIDSDLEIYYKWLIHNKLKLNAKKTLYTLFTQKNKENLHLTITINNVQINRVLIT